MFSNVFVVFILLLGAAVLGFIVAWLFRQARIDQITKLTKKLEGDIAKKDELIKQYSTDRDLIREEADKYKQTYNEQLMKTQRLAENVRQNQSEIERSSEKVKNLTEISIQSQEESKILAEKFHESELMVKNLQNKLDDSQSVIADLNGKILQAQTKIENLKQIQATPKVAAKQVKAEVSPNTEIKKVASPKKVAANKTEETKEAPKRRVISETRRVIRVNRSTPIDIPKGKLSLLDKQKR